MSAEAPKSPSSKSPSSRSPAAKPMPPMPKPRTRATKSNRAQILIFTLLTLLLSAATVWGGRAWLRNSETIVFAVGAPGGPEAKFANRLATVIKNNSSKLRLKVVSNPDNTKALQQFERGDANLAILRTDAKVPPRARTLAILEHDVVLVLSPGGKKIKSVADLKKKKIAVLGDGENSANFVRSALEISDSPDAAQRVHKLTIEGIEDSTRASEISKAIRASGDVAKSRAEDSAPGATWVRASRGLCPQRLDSSAGDFACEA